MTLTIGGALIAAAVLAYFALPKDEFVERLWDLGIINLFMRRAKDIADDDWVQFVTTARHHYRVLGAGNHGYLSSEPTAEKFHSAFQYAIANHHIDVEILWLNPQTQLAERREAEERRDTRFDSVEAIDWFYALAESLGADKPHLRLFEYESTPSCGIVWADDRLIVTQYLPAQADLFAPGLILRKTESVPRRLRKLVHLAPGREREQMADVYISAYKQVRSHAKEITKDRLTELKQASEAFPHHRSEAVLRKEDAEKPKDAEEPKDEEKLKDEKK